MDRSREHLQKTSESNGFNNVLTCFDLQNYGFAVDLPLNYFWDQMLGVSQIPTHHPVPRTTVGAKLQRCRPKVLRTQHFENHH